MNASVRSGIELERKSEKLESLLVWFDSTLTIRQTDGGSDYSLDAVPASSLKVALLDVASPTHSKIITMPGSCIMKSVWNSCTTSTSIKKAGTQRHIYIILIFV